MARSKKSAAAAAEAPLEQVEVEAQANDVSDPAQSSTSAFGKQEHSGRIRGPVEEVIAKRVRTLGKKIQRFRVYAAQPIEKLNADQKSAIASLPILEAQSRELEDLIKSGGPVEVAELGEAAKFRGLKEEVEAKAKSDAESAPGAYQTALATPLSRFLNLYTLLHPARSADHEHLTFSPLELPAQLQDEVQATDILRVGKMWEELLAGGAQAGEVLGGLVKGASGEDEENDHIHHLLKLLSQSPTDSAEPALAAENASDPQPEPATEGDDRQIIEVDFTAPIEESTAGLPNGHAEASATAKKSGGATLNFLQDDELASAAGQEEVQETEEEFEILEQPAAHETEHYDVPETSTPAPEASAVPVIEETTKPTFDWADEHDEPTPVAPAAVPELAAPLPTSATTDQPAIAEIGESSTPPPTGPTRGGRGGRGRGASNGPRRGGNRSNGHSPSTSQSQAQGTETGQVGLPIPPKPSMGRQGSKAGAVVDEDGWETKVRTAPKRGGPVGGGRGRGGAGGQREGGEYRGGGRGRGNGEGRGGRGGFQRGPGGEGQGGQRPPRPQGQGQGQRQAASAPTEA